MFEIDYFKALKDAGIKDSLISVIKKNSNLSEQQIEKMYAEKVEYHGRQMDQYINSYMRQYVDLKTNKKVNDIDEKLDEMVTQFINENNVKDK